MLNIIKQVIRITNYLLTQLHYIRAVFSCVSKVISRLLWFCIAILCDWIENLAPLSRPIRSKPKPIVTRSHAFSRA